MLKRNFMILCLFVMVGCASTGSISDMSQDEKSVWILGIYNSQYTDYMITTGYIQNLAGQWEKATYPELSDDTRKILRQKKELLVQAYPLITVYTSMTNVGLPADKATEQQIIMLLTQLLQL